MDGRGWFLLAGVLAVAAVASAVATVSTPDGASSRHFRPDLAAELADGTPQTVRNEMSQDVDVRWSVPFTERGVRACVDVRLGGRLRYESGSYRLGGRVVDYVTDAELARPVVGLRIHPLSPDGDCLRDRPLQGLTRTTVGIGFPAARLDAATATWPVSAVPGDDGVRQADDVRLAVIATVSQTTGRADVTRPVGDEPLGAEAVIESSTPVRFDTERDNPTADRLCLPAALVVSQSIRRAGADVTSQARRSAVGAPRDLCLSPRFR